VAEAEAKAAKYQCTYIEASAKVCLCAQCLKDSHHQLIYIFFLDSCEC
jgi:hypothetical protein